MGLLADSKSRRKICKDPNNTKWTRDTSTFGHKILRAQGWEPGQYLGAQDAGHSDLYTAANASYIRVSVKDDVKGLGFDKAKEDEVTGLDVFSDLLSRLNGKSEEDVEDARRARLEVKTNAYVQQKWGAMRFVRGGLLVDDTVRGEQGFDGPAPAPPTDVKSGTECPSTKEKRSKKRKLANEEDRDAQADDKKQRKCRKEERRAERARMESSADSSESAERDDAKAKKKPKKKKTSSPDIEPSQPDSADEATSRRPRKSKAKNKESDAPAATADDDDDGSVTAGKRSKRDKKSKSKTRKTDAEPVESGAAESEGQREVADSAPATCASTPVGSGTSTPAGGRNFARSRFVAAKRQAILDTKSLNQIFMI